MNLIPNPKLRLKGETKELTYSNKCSSLNNIKQKIGMDSGKKINNMEGDQFEALEQYPSCIFDCSSSCVHNWYCGWKS